MESGKTLPFPILTLLDNIWVDYVFATEARTVVLVKAVEGLLAI